MTSLALVKSSKLFPFASRSFQELGIFTFLFGALFFAPCASAEIYTASVLPWPTIPDPPNSKVELVSSDMRLNGIPMRIWRFDSQTALEGVVAHYEALWNRVDPNAGAAVPDRKKNFAITKPDGSTAIISRIHGIFYLTVKVKRKDLGTTEGSLSVSKFGGSTASMNTDGIIAPPGAKPISVMESADSGRNSKMVVFMTEQNPSVVSQYYVNALSRDGWTMNDQFQSRKNLKNVVGVAQIFRDVAGNEYQLLLAEGKGGTGTILQVNKISPSN
jgi:hypothetical protein